MSITPLLLEAEKFGEFLAKALPWLVEHFRKHGSDPQLSWDALHKRYQDDRAQIDADLAKKHEQHGP